MEAYSEASKAVFEIFKDTTPLVEGISIDEAFLDVRGMRRIAGSPEQMAERLRTRVREEVGLPITVGVATTKHLAKVASAVAKPDGLLVVPAGKELEFLHPLPVERLWGVGPVTAGKLHARGLTTVGQVAALGEGDLIAVLGRASGRHLHALAHNRDPRRIRVGHRRRSIGTQRALGRRARSPAELDTILVGLVDRLAGRLRKADRICRTVTLRLRFDDFARATRSYTLPESTAETAGMLTALRALLGAAMPMIQRARADAHGHHVQQPRRGGRPAGARPRPSRRARRGDGSRARAVRLGGDHARRPAEPRPRPVDARAAGPGVAPIRPSLRPAGAR